MQLFTIWIHLFFFLENSENEIDRIESGQCQANIVDKNAVYLSGW